jgi:hypothetical protein
VDGSRTFSALNATTAITFVPDSYLNFRNASCWSCDGNAPDGVTTVPAAGDDVIVRMSNTACDWDGLNGARLIVSSDTPLLNSFSVETPYSCCPCTSACANLPDQGSQRPCIGSVVVNAGAKLRAATVVFGVDTRLNLNRGTVETTTFTSSGWVAGTGTVKATTAVNILGTTAHLLPGWFARTTIVELGTFRSCSVQWPRWAPNGEVSMFGDLLFDTPTALFNETTIYFKDLTTMSEFPGRAKSGTPYDTITVTGVLQWRGLQTVLLRSNNTAGSSTGAAPFLSLVTDPFLWGANATLMTFGSFENLDPITWPNIVVVHIADGRPLIPLPWSWTPQPQINSACGLQQTFVCPLLPPGSLPFKKRSLVARIPSCHCQDTSACGAYSQSVFSILVTPVGLSCPVDQFNPDLTAPPTAVLPTATAAGTLSNSTATSQADGQGTSELIPIIVGSVLGAALVTAVIVSLLFRWRHVHRMRAVATKIAQATHEEALAVGTPVMKPQ